MVQKPFEELTIADDTAKQCTSCTLLSYEFSYRKLVTTWYPCHPWQVMEHEPICREFLEMLFAVKIEKITYLSSQNTVTANSGAKSVRLDVLVKDEAGTTYDIEMSFTDRHPCLSVNTSFAVRQNIATAWNQRCWAVCLHVHCSTISFSIEKLTSVWNHRHPWRYWNRVVQKT